MKTRCWTCGETHYRHDCLVERVRGSKSVGHTTIGDLGKSHQIHAAVNNDQDKHHSTVLKMSGTIVD
jgi:hypothetical protein